MPKEKTRYKVLPRVLIFIFHKDEILLIKYSGKGNNPSSEKEQRKDIYNGLGGHIEFGENIIESAVKEVQEEAGIEKINPQIKAIINVNGFYGKDVMNFVITANAKDRNVKSGIEGELEWVKLEDVDKLNTFDDVKPILDKIQQLRNGEIVVGTAKFDGKEFLF